MLQASRPQLILASQSATRKALLAAAGLQVEARPARIDEAAVKQAARAEGRDAGETALLLADLKAARIRDPEALIIGADQILTCGDDWFDKPEDAAAARAQLRALRGREHVLHSAAVCHRGGVRIWQHLAQPVLTMRRFSDAFLDAYLAAEADHVTASVGAYRLEGPGVHLFARIEGEHAAILGLPLLALLAFLRQHGAVLD